jgi:hypothetical protein
MTVEVNSAVSVKIILYPAWEFLKPDDPLERVSEIPRNPDQGN